MGWLSICSVFLQSNSNLLNFEVREPGARRWSSGGYALGLRSKRSGLDSQSRHLNFRDWLSPASKSQYG